MVGRTRRRFVSSHFSRYSFTLCALPTTSRSSSSARLASVSFARTDFRVLSYTHLHLPSSVRMEAIQRSSLSR